MVRYGCVTVDRMRGAVPQVAATLDRIVGRATACAVTEDEGVEVQDDEELLSVRDYGCRR